MTIPLPVDLIKDNPWQTRLLYDDAYIVELALSIEKNGLLQSPVGRLMIKSGQPAVEQDFKLLREASDYELMMRERGWYVELAFGHNRKRAYQHLESARQDLAIAMPVQVLPIPDEDMAVQAWTENAERKDITPLEEARAIRMRMQDFLWTQKEAAAQLGIDRSTVANKLRLLELPEDVQEHILAGRLTERQALAILPIYKLPENEKEIRDALGGWYQPEAIVEMALEGSSSDQLRTRVQQATYSICHAKKRRKSERAEAKKLRALKESTGLPHLSELADIRVVSDEPETNGYTDGCSPACKCRSEAINYSDRTVSICTDPERHDGLRKAQSKKETAAWSREAEALRAEMLRAFSAPSSSFIAEVHDLALLRALSEYHPDTFKEACELVGVDQRLSGLSHFGDALDEAEHLFRLLPSTKKWQLLAATVILEELHTYVTYGREPRNTNIMLGGYQSAAETVGAQTPDEAPREELEEA